MRDKSTGAPKIPRSALLRVMNTPKGTDAAPRLYIIKTKAELRAVLREAADHRRDRAREGELPDQARDSRPAREKAQADTYCFELAFKKIYCFGLASHEVCGRTLLCREARVLESPSRL
jgi:hypothetical protein